MSDALDWKIDGSDWPLREASRLVAAAGFEWHVQELGSGPGILLLHGTGASTHSWRKVAPLLAKSFRVVACDLPGHGFTALPAPRQMSLQGMAEAAGQLMSAIGFSPDLVAGHSAGAAVAIRMTLDGAISPRAIVSLNGALLPFKGFAGHVFSPLAKMLVLNPFVPRLFAWRAADRAAVERVIAGTGSKLEPEDIGLYARLFRSPRHVAGALGMMARWDLKSFARDLPKLQVPLVLVAGGLDRAVPAEDQFQVRDLVPQAKVELLRGLGHLAHEERPELIAGMIERVARDAGIFAAA